jgi:hypothetical protein
MFGMDTLQARQHVVTRRPLRKASLAAAAVVTLMLLAPMRAVADPVAPCATPDSKADGTTAATTPCTASKGEALIEFGYRNQTATNTAASGLIAYPAATVRYGVSNDAEVDASLGSYERVRVGGAMAHGYSDATFGMRYRVLGSGRAIVSAVAAVSTPTGEIPYSPGKPQYSLGLASVVSLRQNLAVQASMGYASRFDASSGMPVWYGTYSPAVALIADSPSGTSFYVEGSGTTKAAPGLGPEYKVGAGVRRPLGSHIVVDVGLKDGLSVVNGSRRHEVDVALSSLFR